MTRIAISTGHGLHIRGASGPSPWGLDEVNEARRVMPVLADYLQKAGHEVVLQFNDDVSTSQNENLERIVSAHNSAPSHDLDVSIHFNAYIETKSGMGCEVEYLSTQDLASRVSSAISKASGMINRGARYRTDLYFLNHTRAPAILLEIAFVDSETDAMLYQKYFDEICRAIARVGNKGRPEFYEWEGMASWFGGPDDDGVSPSEGLAFIYEVSDQPELFLAEQPPETSGLARRLDPNEHYLALRWDYDQTPRDMLLEKKALVRSPLTGKEFLAYPADWGPHVDTGRIADLSPKLLEDLGLETDDIVRVIFPAP